MDTIRRNYDLVATAAAAGVLLVVDAPWPLWAIWGTVTAYQVGNRVIRGWAR